MPDTPSPRTGPGGAADPQVPPTDRRRIAAAAVCLAVPVVALMLVNTYAQDGPRLFGFPFFYWYQFLWVFLCSGFTWTAYVLVRSARPRPDARAGTRAGEGEDR